MFRLPAASFVCVLILALAAQAASEQSEEPILLRYKGPSNVCYLVVREAKLIKHHEDDAVEKWDERAVVKYGARKVRKDGTICLAPEDHLIEMSENMGKLKDGKILPVRCESWFHPQEFISARGISKTFWPVKGLEEEFDLYPVFPERAVQVGEFWTAPVKFSFGFKQRVSTEIEHRLVTFKNIDGRRCAEIEYTFSVELSTAEHPEMLVDEIVEQTKPAHTVNGRGIAYFDPAEGIIVRKEKHVTRTHKWLGKLDDKMLMTLPNWPRHRDQVTSSMITVELISEQEADRLIRQAEEDRRQTAEAAKLAPPVVETGPSWKYMVEVTTTRWDSIRDQNDVFVDRAFVHYGANAKEAGGQNKDIPYIVHVDENNERLKRASGRGSRLQSISIGKLGLCGELPLGAGYDSNFPFPLDTFAISYDILPMEPPVELERGLRWSSVIYFNIGWTTEVVFPITISYEVTDYQQKGNRKCAVIKYTLAGEFKTDEHPERITEERRRELRGEYHVNGNGTAYYDSKAGIVVEKEQAIAWTSFGEKFEGGTIGWRTTADDGQCVKIRVSLEPQ